MMSEFTEGEVNWYVVRTQTKRENAAATYIKKELGLEVVAPKIRYTKATRRGKVLWKEAMFPGYIFVKFDRFIDEKAVCYAPGVLKLVQFGDYVPKIEEEFVLQISAILGDSEMLDLEQEVQQGREYEVVDGVLKGEVGEVLEILPGGQRVMMLLEMIGGKQAVEVDVYSLLLPKPGVRKNE